jgi:CHAT domain-containing protein
MPIFLADRKWAQYYQCRYAITYNLVDLYQFEKAAVEIEAAIAHFEGNTIDTFLIQQPKLYHAAGQVYLDLHQYDKAIASNRMAMKHYQNILDENERTKYTSYMYNNIASVFKEKRTMDSAMYYFELALPLKIKALGPNANSTLRTIKAISTIYQDWGQLDKAIETQTIALNGAIKAENRDAEAQAYNGLSQMYQRKNDFESSKIYISKAMEIYKELAPKYEYDLAHCYHQMGNVLEAATSHKESIQWYTTAKQMYHKLNNDSYSYHEGNTTMNLGKAHNYLAGQLEATSTEIDASHPEVRALRARAIKFYEENERIFEATVSKDHARWIELWLSKGSCYLENRDTLLAHELFQKAYDRAYKMAPEKSYDRSLACLSLASTTKDLTRAIEIYQQGLWELSREWEYDSPEDNPTAQQVFYENWAVRIMIEKASKLQEMASLQQNDLLLDSGIKTIIAADDLLDESRASFLTTSAKIFLGKMGHEVYSKGVALSYHKGDSESQAFDFIEKNKGLVLLEALHSGRRIQDVMVPDSLSSGLRRISAKIAELTAEQNQYKEDDRYAVISAQIFDLEQERKRIKAKITQLYPMTERISEEGQTLSLKEVQLKLAPNEVIYEYLKTDDDLYILRIQENSAKLYKEEVKGFATDLDSLLAIISNEDIAINKGNSRAVYSSLQKYSHRLFKKLLPDYNNENLLIIPDGNLNYLPFELLLTKPASGDQINYSLLPYLLKSGNIKYAFSTSLHFAEANISKNNQGQFLAIAPSYPSLPTGFLASRVGFSSLEHTEKEATSISDLMGGDYLIGSDATVERFKESASNYRVLHLAMHAYTHDKDPMLSGMVFSESASDDDNILHAYELYNMDVTSELVVLSACNTGLGQYKEGEGVMSLGRAFRHAGTKNVMMSLWQANDESTSKIMTSFYQNIDNGVPKAEALRSAKLDYLATNTNVFPYYWSAFVLLGDDQVLTINNGNSLMIGFSLGLVLLIILAGYFAIPFFRAKFSSPSTT